MSVARDARRRGLGTALLQALLEDAKERGWRSVRLETTADWEDAVQFYGACGFGTRRLLSHGSVVLLRRDGKKDERVRPKHRFPVLNVILFTVSSKPFRVGIFLLAVVSAGCSGSGSSPRVLPSSRPPSSVRVASTAWAEYALPRSIAERQVAVYAQINDTHALAYGGLSVGSGKRCSTPTASLSTCRSADDRPCRSGHARWPGEPARLRNQARRGSRSRVCNASLRTRIRSTQTSRPTTRHQMVFTRPARDLRVVHRVRSR